MFQYQFMHVALSKLYIHAAYSEGNGKPLQLISFPSQETLVRNDKVSKNMSSERKTIIIIPLVKICNFNFNILNYVQWRF